jgi:hypothetical protein
MSQVLDGALILVMSIHVMAHHPVAPALDGPVSRVWLQYDFA